MKIEQLPNEKESKTMGAEALRGSANRDQALGLISGALAIPLAAGTYYAYNNELGAQLTNNVAPGVGGFAEDVARETGELIGSSTLETNAARIGADVERQIGVDLAADVTNNSAAGVLLGAGAIGAAWFAKKRFEEREKKLAAAGIVGK